MAIRSAGLLVYRKLDGKVEVLLVHPGGPFWARKDEAAWSIPKGIVEPSEDELSAAKREAREELGVDIEGRFDFLGEYKQSGPKVVVAWSIQVNDTFRFKLENSATITIEWPPRSGKQTSFPEVDRAEWFSVKDADQKLHKGQRGILADFIASAGMETS